MRLGIRELIFLLLLLSLPVAAYFFVFKPRNIQIAEVRREISQKQVKLEQLQAATKSIEDLGEEIEKLSEAIVMFEEKLPAEREVEVVLKQVWELAAHHKLTPKKIRSGVPINTTQYSELPLNMTILGDFDGFYGFMLDLEKLRRITRMPKMHLKRSKSKENGQMLAEIVLSIFFESHEQQYQQERLSTRNSS